MMSGIGVASLDIALQSRCSRQWGEPTISTSFAPASAVEQKIALGRPQRFDGQRHVRYLRASAWPLETPRPRTPSPARGVTPGSRLRCCGEPKTMIEPPRSRHRCARSRTYSAVLLAHGAVGAGQIVARRLGQQPVQPDDLQVGGLGLAAHLGCGGRR